MTGLEPATIAAITSAASTGLSVVQSQQEARAQSRQAQAKLEEMERRRAISQRQARTKLRKDLATQRARAGASGLTGSRSADAILANLQRETERRLADENWLFNREAVAIRDAAAASSKTSLLDIGQTLIGGISDISRSGILKQLSSSPVRGNPRFAYGNPNFRRNSKSS